MRSAFTIVAAGLLVACGRDSSTATDGAARSDGAGFAGKAALSVAAPPASVAAAMPIGIAGQVAGERAPMADETAQAGTAGDPLRNVTAGTADAPAMIIRTGQAFVEVRDVDAAVLRIRQLAARVGGYVASSSTSGGRDQIRQSTLELKIPSNRYEEAVSSLSDVGKVETVNSSAQDVGEEFVDVNARVNNSRRLEERLITLLSNRTGKLDEVLRVERELARVREEIERYEGRLRYLTSRVAMSTLTITVHEPAPILGRNPGENPIVAALRRAWRNFVSLVAAAIASLGILIPIALVAAGAWFGFKRWIKPRISG